MNIEENNDGHWHPLVVVGEVIKKIATGRHLTLVKSNAGRKAFEVTETVLLAVEHYAARGLNNKQMAACLGISYQTFNEKKKQFSEFSDAIERGQAFGISEITDALYTKAKKGDIFAIKYFLNNRSKQDWSEKPEIEVNNNTQVNIIIDNEDLNA
jgi:hypothetical protein